MSEAIYGHSSVLLKQVDSNRLVANSQLSVDSKSALGQYMTPAPVAEFMASLFQPVPLETIRLLDPGAGVGSLTSALIERLVDTHRAKDIYADAYEIDSLMASFLNETIHLCESLCASHNMLFSGQIKPEDFILSASKCLFEASGLFPKELHTYTHCIMNPPYKKISSSSEHRKALRAVGIETSNMYSAFVALAVKLLEPGGELVAIIPRSFCNGSYFKRFRRLLLKDMSIKQIHIFDSRKQTFKDDDILQENIILYAIKKENQDKVVKISSSTDADFSDLSESMVDYETVVNPADNNCFIHIAATDRDREIAKRMGVFSNSLSQLGIDVLTGPVVDFRLKEHLLEEPGPGCCPLIYPCHFDKGRIRWPIASGKKPNALSVTDDTQRWLVPDGYYTLTRRFSAKEEKKRIVSSVYAPGIHQSEYIGFENHLNVFHKNRKGLPPLLAKGLSIFLDSTLVDLFFRQFSGHTQVNANDLRQMRYPGTETLVAWGAVFDDVVNRQLEVDQLVDIAIEAGMV
ncbi:MAG: N-6 DNA methylase [bacterium]|nr:N-6 DNA methylase [bacterium]